MENLLLPDKRQAPMFYNVEFRGKKERTVSIRGGITFPQADRQGYFCLVAQLERPLKEGESSKEDKILRFLAFEEGRAPLMKDFFEKISEACRTWRVDRLCCGDEKGDKDFYWQLDDYLKSKKEGYEVIQKPSVYKSWRSQQLGFLFSMVREHLAKKTLLLFNITDKRTPLLNTAVSNTPRDADISEMQEIKALSYVMDDFDCNPWTAPEPEEKGQERTPWASF
jgi:hypothetical protein